MPVHDHSAQHALPSYLNPDDVGPWGTYLKQVDRVTPYLGSLARWVETLKRPKRILIVDVPIEAGNPLSTRKLLNRMAPIRMVKIMAEVFTVSIRQSKNIFQVIVRAITASNRAPDAPMPAASSGEKNPR